MEAVPEAGEDGKLEEKKDKKKTEMGLWDLGNPSYLSSNIINCTL